MKGQEQYERHLGRAMGLKSEAVERPTMPVDVFADEGLGMARLALSRWEPRREGEASMSDVGALYPRERVLALEEVLLGLQYVEGILPLSEEARSKLPGLKREAEGLRRKLSGALGVVLDDGVEDESDEALARLRGMQDLGRAAKVASTLRGWLGLAERHAEELGQIKSFDAGWIARGYEVVGGLSKYAPVDRAEDEEGEPEEAGGGGEVGVRVEGVSLREVRNRFYTLARVELGALRRRAQFVFGDEPDTARQFSSEYARQRRAAASRASDPSA